MARRKKKSNFLLNIVLLIALGVFVYSGFNLWTIYSGYKAGQDEYKEISQIANAVPDKENNKKKTIDFAALEKQNADIIGWIQVEGTVINYPIMKGENNDTYLHTTFNKKYNFAGSIFVDERNGTDFAKEPNMIVYGHHMKDGTMFKDLTKFMDYDFFQKDRKIVIYTKEKTFYYKAFASYITHSTSDTYLVFEEDAFGKEPFTSYFERMNRNGNSKKVTFTGKEPIVTLSTCTDSDGPRRTVVQAVLDKVEDVED